MDILRPRSSTPPSSRSAVARPASRDNVPQGASSAPKAPLTRRHFLGRFLIIGSILLFLGFVIAAGFLFKKGLAVSREIQLNDTQETGTLGDLGTFAKGLITPGEDILKKDEDGRINVLLLGRAGEHYPGKNLTDTVILLSIQTKTRQVALLSLPRDLLVALPGSQPATKLNALYQYGLSSGKGPDTIREAVSTVTDQSIHYTFLIDFDGFEELVDTLGGIRVDVPRDFTDTRYPGKNYSYETFSIQKGWQTLDGPTALKYVRERHADPEGDFGRAKRQQQVLQALKSKAFSLPTLVNPETLSDLLDTLGQNVETDASLTELEAFFKLAHSIDTQNVKTLVVDAWQKESLLRVSHIPLGGVSAFILLPRAGNWSEIQERSAYIFDQDVLARQKTALAEEAPRVLLVAAPQETTSLQSLRAALEEMGIAQIEVSSASFEEAPKESIIVDRSGLKKPFTLDALLKKFPLEKQTEGQVAWLEKLPVQSRTKADLIIAVGSDFAKALPEEEYGSQSDDLSPETFPLVTP